MDTDGNIYTTVLLLMPILVTDQTAIIVLIHLIFALHDSPTKKKQKVFLKSTSSSTDLC